MSVKYQKNRYFVYYEAGVFLHIILFGFIKRLLAILILKIKSLSGITNILQLFIYRKLQKWQLVYPSISYYQFQQMNSQNNAEDSMNFSVIDKNDDKINVDFSIQSLLQIEESSKKDKEVPEDLQITKEKVFNKIKTIKSSANKSLLPVALKHKQEACNEFLRDLSKAEKQLSFETQLYNIYEDYQNNSTEIVHNNKSKTLSYLKVTKEFTNKSISKESYQDFNDYQGELIIDFQKKDPKNKEKVISKNDSKSITNNISSQQSNSNKGNTKQDIRNSKEKLAFFRAKDKIVASKSKIAPFQHRKSKSKSLTTKFGLTNSKSQSHLKTSTQAQTFQQKVFTQYYGTQIHFKPQRQQKKKQKVCINTVRSRQKSSKSKLGLLSPRTKQGQKPLHKK